MVDSALTLRYSQRIDHVTARERGLAPDVSVLVVACGTGLPSCEGVSLLLEYLRSCMQPGDLIFAHPLMPFTSKSSLSRRLARFVKLGQAKFVQRGIPVIEAMQPYVLSSVLLGSAEGWVFLLHPCRERALELLLRGAAVGH